MEKNIPELSNNNPADINARIHCRIETDKSKSPVFIILAVNDNFRRITGLNSEITTQKLSEVFSSAEIRFTDELVKTAIEESESTLQVYICEDLYNAYIFSPAKHECIAVFSKAVKEKPALDLEKHFKTAFFIHPTPMLISTPDEGIIEANREFLNLMGVKREEVIGRDTVSLDLLLNPADRAKAVERLKKFGYLKDFESVMKSRNGNEMTFLISVIRLPLYEKDSYLTVFNDITSQKKFQEEQNAVKRERTLLQTILNSIPVMITIYFPDVSKITVNREFEKILGWTQDEIDNDSIMEMVYPDPVYRKEISEFMLNGSGWHDIKMTIKDGSVIETAWANIKIPDGRQVGIGLDLRNIKKAQEELRANQAVLEAFFASSPGILNIFDENLNYINTDSLTPTYFNLNRDSIIGKSVKDLNPEFADNLLEGMSRKVIEKNEIIKNLEVEGPIPGKDSETGNWLMSYFPVPLPNNKKGFGTIGIEITKQKKAEKALRESEVLYRELAENLEVERGKLAAIIENLPIGIGVADATGRTLSMNRTGLLVHGFSSEKDMFARLDDYIREFELKYLDGSTMPVEEWPASRALKGEYVENYELILHNKVKDIEKILSYTCTPVRDNEWNVVLLVYVIQDLTEKKKAAKDLQESEERFRTLADNISQLAWMADGQGSIFWYNKRWYDYTGLSFDESKMNGWEKIHHPDYILQVKEKFSDAILKGEPWEDIFPMKNNSGEYRWFLSRALPVYDEKGNITRWFGTNTDITEQKKLEEELNNALSSIRENEARLLEAQELATMGTAEIITQTGEIRWSDTMYRIFERDKSLGPPSLAEAMKYIHPDDILKAAAIQNASAKPKEKLQTELRILLPGNKMKYIIYIGSPQFDESGNQIKRLGAVIDITERKLSQLKLEEAYSQIEERLREKEVLLRELYHRTKNNMQVISSLLGLKSSLFSEVRIQEVFEDMQDRIRSIALVHEKLYQSKNLSKVSLRDYIIDLTKLLCASHSELAEKIRFRYELEEISVMIDTAVPCGLILTELLINAFKHAFPGSSDGEIKIELKKLDEQVISLTLSDNGVGLKEPDIANESKLGLQLFRSIAENQLDAVVSLDTTNGVSWTIRFRDTLYNERI